MDQQRFWQLVSLKLSGEATSDELRELENFLQQNPEAGFKLDVMSGIWKETPISAQPQLPFNAHLQRLRQSEREDQAAQDWQPQASEATEAPDPEIKRRKISYFLIAASVVALSFCGMHIYRQSMAVNADVRKGPNIVETQKGSRTTVQLPDGTKVWLNADSRIYYDESFKDQYREVQLEGEAFFDVKKDSSRPFIIHTSEVDIKVLGTRFNVKSYNNEDETETALVTGTVEICIKKNPDKKIILHPNEKLVVKHRIKVDAGANKNLPQETMLVVKNMRHDSVYNRSPETLWMDNKLAFDGESLEEVCKKLERWYDVKIRIQDEGLKTQTYTAIFDGETLLNVLTALKLTDKLDFSIQNKEVLIFTKKAAS